MERKCEECGKEMSVVFGRAFLPGNKDYYMCDTCMWEDEEEED